MKKKLTKFQIWTRLAQLWDKPKKWGTDYYVLDSFGICNAYWSVCGEKKLNQQETRLLKQMSKKLGGNPEGTWYFDFSRASARKRAALCRLMAAHYRPKRKVAK